MADKFSEILQTYVNYPYSKLLGIAQSCLGSVINLAEEITDGDQDMAVQSLLLMIGSMYAVDMTFSELEFKFLNDVFDIDVPFDQAKGIVQESHNRNASELTTSFFKIASGETNEVKTDVLTFFVCLAAIDETISGSEASMLRSLASSL